MPAPMKVTAAVTPPVVGMSPARFVWVYSPNPGAPIPPHVTAHLSGAGVLSATVGVSSDSVPAALSGSGTLMSVVAERYNRSAALSGSGVLSSAVGVRSDSIPVSLSGVGTLSAIVSFPVTATLSGSGALVATVSLGKDSVPAILSGTGTLTATAVERYAQTVTLSGSGTLAATTSASYARTATLSGGGTLSGTVGISKDSIPAALSGSGTLSATVSAGATGVAFDQVSSISSGTSSSISFSFTAAAGADVFLCIGANFGSNSNTALSSIKYGSSSMTLVGQQANNGTNGATYVYRLAGGGTGSALNLTGTWATATNFTAVGISCIRVGSTGTTVKAQGASTSPSTGAATCPTKGMLLSVIGQGGYFGSPISAPTGGTNRAIGNQSGNASGISVSTATATTNFGATLANPYNWGAVVVPLNP